MLGVGARPPLALLAVEVTHVADLDAPRDELLARGVDVVHDEVRPAVRPGRRLGDPDPDRDRAR